MVRRALLALAFISLACSRKDPASEQARAEREFEQLLTNSVLAGKFSAGSRISEDRYLITKATRISSESWLIHSKFGKSPVAIPIPVTVKWAGDTPVITLTDAGIPGMGTFSARVLFYRGQYAGTWSSTKHGGQMWGVVERVPQQP